jgi:hypothetical protein
MQKKLFPILAVIPIVLALILGGRLLSKPPSISVLVDTVKSTATLEQEYSLKVKEVTDWRKQVERFNPGPEPSRIWHPFDYWQWCLVNKAYEDAINAHDKATEELNQLEDRLSRDSWHKIKSFLGGIWNTLFRPVFELLLMLALFSFGLRVGFRYMIMRGWIGIVRV